VSYSQGKIHKKRMMKATQLTIENARAIFLPADMAGFSISWGATSPE
jgi:hypothetical protein